MATKLTAAQRTVLEYLATDNARLLKTLFAPTYHRADHIGRGVSTATVNALSNAGFVTVEKQELNMRVQCRVTITDAGRTAISITPTVTQPVDLDALGMSIIAEVVADLNKWDTAEAGLKEQVDYAVARQVAFSGTLPVIGGNRETEESMPEMISYFNGDTFEVELTGKDGNYTVTLIKNGSHVRLTWSYEASARRYFKELVEQETKAAQEQADAPLKLIQHLALIQLDSFTPLEALTHLYELKREAAKLLG